MSDSIGHDATPHPRDASSYNNNDSSDSDNVSTPQFLSRPHSRQSNSNHSSTTRPLAPVPGATTAAAAAAAAEATTATATATTSNPAREAFRPSVFGNHRKDTKAKSKPTTTNSEDMDSDPFFSSDDDDDNDEKDPRGGRHGRRHRRRRFSDSASHLLAQAPPVPDLRFDHNYRKALDQIYETHAKETARAHAHAARRIDSSDENKATTTTTTTTTATTTATAGSLPKQQQKPSTEIRRVPSIAARVTVMTLRDIIIMPFIHGFFWGFGTILITLVGQRTLVYHVQRTWHKLFGGNPDEVVNASRGQPARIRRIGGAGVNGGLGGVGLRSAGSAPGGFTKPGYAY